VLPRFRTVFAALLLASGLVGCDTICECQGFTTALQFTGSVSAKANNVVTFKVASVQLGAADAQTVAVRYRPGDLAFLTRGSTYRVSASGSAAEWNSVVPRRGPCACAPATTKADGRAIDTSLLRLVAHRYVSLVWLAVAAWVLLGVLLWWRSRRRYRHGD
jgi:hypothetical protein